MKTIPNKETFLKLSKEGKLGNTFQVWDSLEELHTTSTEFVTIRNREKDSPFFVPNVAVSAVSDKVIDMAYSGLDINTAYFQEIPHEFGCTDTLCQGCGRILNGEAMRDESYLYLMYGTNPNQNLRDDLNKNGLVVSGLSAVLYLKSLECIDDLNEIWDEYPNSIIEFSVFNRKVGKRKSNTIIWETREY